MKGHPTPKQNSPSRNGCWQLARNIREYIAAIHESINAGKSRIANAEHFAEWMEAANWYANHVDPLVQAKPRPAMQPEPTRCDLSRVELTSHLGGVLNAMGVTHTDELVGLTEAQLKKHSDRAYGALSEIRRVLEGLGYKVPQR